MTDPNDIEIHCAHDELRDPVSLVPHPRNPNTHPQRQIDMLARIIAAQGWRAPISISSRSGYVVRGHGRLEAALALGCHSVPVDMQDYDNEASELADLVADNRIAELAEIDHDVLAETMAAIVDLDTDAGLWTGFEDVEIEEIKESAGIFDGVNTTEVPEMPSGGKSPFRQMTFTIHDEQFETIKKSLDTAKAQGGDISDLNENSNGNALHFVCASFING